ncbi:hypothetical protein BKA70DRAFT_1416311 [Coprinopsis sp. MPI-PUGE-AT-0042]|nr:hypothetical protein BKA70DRAFT_1416311 [Coprinopsis sp. MPI-PUGE-AT-0042]
MVKASEFRLEFHSSSSQATFPPSFTMQLPVLISVFFAYMGTTRAAPVPPPGDSPQGDALDVMQRFPSVDNHTPAKPIPIPRIKSDDSRPSLLAPRGARAESPDNIVDLFAGQVLGGTQRLTGPVLGEHTSNDEGDEDIDPTVQDIGDEALTRKHIVTTVEDIDHASSKGVGTSYFEAFEDRRRRLSRGLHNRQGEGREDLDRLAVSAPF